MRALRSPQAAQERKLRACLKRNAQTAFGSQFGFAAIRSCGEFARRVPLAEYADFEPWVERIRRGEQDVLTREPVTHLVPTSGSTGARKLIPFTAGLQREFDAAIGPWLADLVRQKPGLLAGPAYWSITPATQGKETETSAVPVGFADDASYLGGMKSRLVRAALLSPEALNGELDLEAFRRETLLCLLRERELRLISVWHPSFLGLLLEALPGLWEMLLAEIYREDGGRARELQRANPRQPESLWPRLQLISCWGHAHAALALQELRGRFPNTFIQPKGLLATEACVTIPFAGKHPLAVGSHFFEFVDEDGRIQLANELAEGRTYEVIVTTSGGLWRYRLGDLVQVDGRVGETPSLRFLGRDGGVCDRFGEKLAEGFVAQVVHEALVETALKPRFAMLAPEDGAERRYVLYIEGSVPPTLAARLDELLRRNPHYDWCRQLGQLQRVEIFHVQNGYETFVAHEMSQGRRLGEIKPAALSSDPGWSRRFECAKPPAPVPSSR